MREKVLIAALILVLVAGAAYCQSSKTGTAGAQELRIPVGPRGTSMAGAVVADATGSDALFWNPAGAAKTTGTNAFLAYKGYLADMTVSYFGVLSQF
ncbi:MAG TPA: hypothetical protein VMU02_04845, partial [bacterium]|nr:hypothetical protein [bacterium]